MAYNPYARGLHLPDLVVARATPPHLGMILMLIWLPLGNRCARRPPPPIHLNAAELVRIHICPPLWPRLVFFFDVACSTSAPPRNRNVRSWPPK